jgi:hypothetical protein
MQLVKKFKIHMHFGCLSWLATNSLLAGLNIDLRSIKVLADICLFIFSGSSRFNYVLTCLYNPEDHKTSTEVLRMAFLHVSHMPTCQTAARNFS